MMEKSQNNYLTRREAAKYLRVSVRKLDALAAEGRIPYSKLQPGLRGRVVYRRQDLDRFVESNLVRINAAAERVDARC